MRKAPKTKTTVAKEAGFSIRVKGGGFIVQVRRHGINETKTFATLEAARLHCRQLDTKRTNEGLAGFALTSQQRDDATTALKLLGERASLTSAAQAWLRLNPTGESLTVTQLFAQNINDLRQRGRREKTIQTRRQFLNRFAVDYGARAASTILRNEVEQWLTLRVPERTFNTMRGCLMTAFAYAVDKRLVEVNPVMGIKAKVFDREEPHFWSVTTIESIMRAAKSRDAATVAQQAKMKRPPTEPWLPLTPYFALSAFGGLRPDEVARLNWTDINFDSKLIRLPAAASKVRRSRLIPMKKNLIEWLLPYRRDAGPIAPSPATVRNARKAILTKAELPAGWPQDVLRHSFATHWMAAFADIGRLAEILGNSPAVIQRHYKGLTTKNEGQKYFGIVPVREGKILQLKTAKQDQKAA